MRIECIQYTPLYLFLISIISKIPNSSTCLVVATATSPGKSHYHG